ADCFSASLARTALTLAVLLAALGMAAWILRAPVPAWVWVCVWPDALTRARQAPDERPDPRRRARCAGHCESARRRPSRQCRCRLAGAAAGQEPLFARPARARRLAL